MNNLNRQTQKHLKRFPSNGKQSEQIQYLKDAVEQLSADKIQLETKVKRLQSLLNPEITTKRILELIDRVKEHTSEMPDQLGKNRDHDSRYVTLAMWENLINGKVNLQGLWIGIWKWFAVGNDLLMRWDRNYGVGDIYSDADFNESGEPYEQNYPE